MSRVLIVSSLLVVALPACDPSTDVPVGATCETGQVVCGDDCCTADEQCNTATATCEPKCVPSCKNRECGPDGCGGVCGTCQSGFNCQPETGLCYACKPSCDGKSCGSDGCDRVRTRIGLHGARLGGADVHARVRRDAPVRPREHVRLDRGRQAARPTALALPLHPGVRGEELRPERMRGHVRHLQRSRDLHRRRQVLHAVVLREVVRAGRVRRHLRDVPGRHDLQERRDVLHAFVQREVVRLGRLRRIVWHVQRHRGL